MTATDDGERRVNRSQFIARVADRAGVDLRVTATVYDALVEEIIDTVRRGARLTLTGFGKFYPQQHKGHRVQRMGEAGAADAGDAAGTVDDYAVLKFSATRAVNRRLDRGNEA